MTDQTDISRISNALKELLAHHRIVFWYDEGGKMYDFFLGIEVTSLGMGTIRKVEIDHNAFTLKYQMVKEFPNDQFIVYSKQSAPDNGENWLLDLQLSGGLFFADLNALYAAECHIPIEFRYDIVEEHSAFFIKKGNRTVLAGRLTGHETKQTIEWTMLMIACQCDGALDELLFVLFTEAQKKKNPLYNLVKAYQLETVLWNEINRRFNYTDKQGIKNLIIILFKMDLQRHFGQTSLAGDALLFMNKWKDSNRFQKSFFYWSELLAKELDIMNALMDKPIELLLKVDTYSCINWIIATALQSHLLNKTMTVQDAEKWINARQQLLFFNRAEHTLLALSAAFHLLDEVNRCDLTITDSAQGFHAYCNQHYLIDMYYRHYFQEVALAENGSILSPVSKIIEQTYSNSFLLPLNNQWQQQIDDLTSWKISEVINQNKFYTRYIDPYVNKNIRTFVIISDALRYESAKELESMINSLNKYSTTMYPPMLSMLPSYTQLGMAALLPQQILSYESQSDIVSADGVSTQGTDQRTKILQKKLKRSIAMTAETLLGMDSKNGRDYFKGFNVVYIYSNIIDKAGDNKTSEGTVCNATLDEFKHIIRMVKHIGNCNGSKILITADHGYIYQNEPLDETDFSDFKTMGTIYKQNRRFVIGQDLVDGKGVKTWQSEQLGLKSGTTLQTVNSINRIRIQGAGSRFVHGGAALQEIVIPVLEVRMSRKTDISEVEVEVIGNTSRITSNQLTVSFYQTNVMTEKVKSIDLRIGFYDESNQLISDVVNFTFDSTAEIALLREKKYRFTFTNDVAHLNGKEVELRMAKTVPGSDLYTLYKSTSYKMAISFTAEF